MSTAAEVQSTGLFHPRRLGHVNLWVDNLKRAETFYNDVCGLAVEFWETDLVASFLGTGTTPHDLGMIETTGGDARYGLDGVLQITAGVGTTRGLGHLAWELTNEVELVEGYRRLLELGIEPEMTVDHQIAHSIYVRDPDGIQIEFYCDTVKDWSAVLHGELKLVTSFWTPGEEPPFSDSRVADDPEHHGVETAAVHPDRLTHVVLVTGDLDRMLEFYQSIAGLSLVKLDQESRVAWLGGTETSYRSSLVIAESQDPSQIGYHHASFDLGNEAELDRTIERLRLRGIEPEWVVETTDKKSVFLLDPDGLRSEFYASRTGALPNAYGGDRAGLLHSI